MDLSILIISWNTLDMTRACLASVFEGLGGLSAEVIVVDNASDDGTVMMIEAEFSQVRLIRNDRNRGFAAANNQAIAEASGRHVLLLNSDTLVRGDVLPASVAFLDAHPDVGAMGCKVLNIDGSVQETNFDFPTLPRMVAGIVGLRKLGLHRPNPERETDVDVVAGCYILVRRAVIEQDRRPGRGVLFLRRRDGLVPTDARCRLARGLCAGGRDHPSRRRVGETAEPPPRRDAVRGDDPAATQV